MRLLQSQIVHSHSPIMCNIAAARKERPDEDGFISIGSGISGMPLKARYLLSTSTAGSASSTLSRSFVALG